MITVFAGVFLAVSSAFAGSFTDDLRADVMQVRQENPGLVVRIDSMQPIQNRAGSAFFPGADLADEQAQRLIQHRLIFGQDEASVQVGLALALTGEYRLPWSVISTFPDRVRSALLNGYKNDGADDAQRVFEQALSDASPRVRSEAMRLLGYRPDLRTEALTEAMRNGLSDEDVAVRRFTVRSIAWRSEQWGFDAIVPLLSDADAGVRGAAVRALTQLDAARIRVLPELANLSDDPDVKVQRPLRRLLSE